MGLITKTVGAGIGGAGAVSGIFAANSIAPGSVESFIPVGGAYPFQDVNVLSAIAPTLAGLNPIILAGGAAVLGYMAYRMITDQPSAPAP